MRFRLYLVAALALLGSTSTAEAHTTIIEPEGSHFPYQRWVDEAKVPTPDVTLAVVETATDHGCPGRELNYPGCTAPWLQTIWIAPEAVAGAWPRGIFYHELAHNVDFAVLPEWMRKRFMLILLLEAPWVVEGEPKSPSSPDEKFAEVYAECAVKPHISRREVRALGFGPVFQGNPLGGAIRHNRICRMLARL